MLLRKKQGTWNAYGYPCCGSSDICVNRTLPLGAIIVLRQGNTNMIENMSLSKKVQTVATGIEVYRWDKYEVDKAIDLAVDISTSVPVIGFSCLPDKSAVDTLKNYLEGIGIWN